MAEALHAGALGACAVGACCVALDGPRPRLREAVLALLMLVAMLDAVVLGPLGAGVLPSAAWAALIVAGSLALAVRRPRTGAGHRVTVMRAHAAAGGILMAALMLVMSTPAVSLALHHGGAGGAVRGIVGAAVLGYVVSCVARMRRAHRLERVQYATMAAGLLALVVAMIGGG